MSDTEISVCESLICGGRENKRTGERQNGRIASKVKKMS